MTASNITRLLATTDWFCGCSITDTGINTCTSASSLFVIPAALTTSTAYTPASESFKPVKFRTFWVRPSSTTPSTRHW